MPQSAKGISEILGADTPTTNDLLGYKRFTVPIVRRIINATGKSTPLTIGVYGEWGSGKTSFLKMIDEALREEDIHPIWFNAWKYDQEANLWAALIQTILSQATVNGKWQHRIWIKLQIWWDTWDLRSGSWEIAKGLFSGALRILIIGLGLLFIFGWSSSEISAFLNQAFSQWFSANPLTLTFFQTNVIKAIAAIIAFFAAKPDEWLKLFDAKLGIDFSKLKRSTSYRAHIAFLDEFSDEFRRIIKLVGSGKPLVVVIDDLDRCLPEKAIQVLEAIKLFLDVEGCVFLLAVDRDVVEKAIAVKYKELLAMAKNADTSPRPFFTLLGESYFEKIVQLPFSLPPISGEQFRDFVEKVHPDDDVQLCATIFTEGFPRNPRKVKRLLQTFLFLRDLSLVSGSNDKQKKKPSLIAKMVIIQNQFREVYEEIVNSPALLPELEKHYYRQASPSTSDNLLETPTDPVLQEKVKVLSAQYPNLRNLLLQKVRDDDTFVDVDLAPYISLAEPIIDIQVTSESVTTGGLANMSGSLKVEHIFPLLGQYLQNVIRVTQSLNLRGLSSTAPASKVDIEKIYVATSFTSLEEDRERLSRSQLTLEDIKEQKSLNLEGILQRSVRVVILGGAGTGKTTLLSYLANTFASALLQRSTPAQNILGISENILPILIPLRQYGRYVEQNPNKSASPAGFMEFLDNYFLQWNIELPSGFFIQFLERGNCILLLDGLDEVISPAREFVTQTILSVAQRYPISRIIVTSRPATYFPYGLGGDFAHYEISSFDKSSIAQFIHNWLSLAFQDQAKVNQRAESLLYAITENSQLSVFTQNPLLLTVLVILYYNRRDVPLHRVDLYEDALDVLLARWDSAKGIQPSKTNLAGIKNLLATLAFTAQNAGIDEMNESLIVSVFSKELMRKELSLQSTDALAQSFSLLADFKERAGILIERSPHTFSFVHRTFREYLAAIALTQRDDFVDLVLQKKNDDFWRESIAFAVGYISGSSPKIAEKVIHKLLETQNPKSIILAGQCLLQTRGINQELRENVVNALSKLPSNTTGSSILSVQLSTML